MSNRESNKSVTKTVTLDPEIALLCVKNGAKVIVSPVGNSKVSPVGNSGRSSVVITGLDLVILCVRKGTKYFRIEIKRVASAASLRFAAAGHYSLTLVGPLFILRNRMGRAA